MEYARMMMEFLIHMAYFGGIPNGIIMIAIAWMARDLSATFFSTENAKRDFFSDQFIICMRF